MYCIYAAVYAFAINLSAYGESASSTDKAGVPAVHLRLTCVFVALVHQT
jgi:hypothetical protein